VTPGRPLRHTPAEEVVTVHEPDPRVPRYAADVDLSTLPEPVALADTVVEQPASPPPPSGDAWDGDGD
jgi:hypothetical protein